MGRNLCTQVIYPKCLRYSFIYRFSFKIILILTFLFQLLLNFLKKNLTNYDFHKISFKIEQNFHQDKIFHTKMNLTVDSTSKNYFLIKNKCLFIPYYYRSLLNTKLVKHALFAMCIVYCVTKYCTLLPVLIDPIVLPFSYISRSVDNALFIWRALIIPV